MSTQSEWSTFEGPFSGNAVFEASALRPPLMPAWTRKGLAHGFHSGMRVGGGGRVVVADGTTGLLALDARTGAEVWSTTHGRKPDGECALVGGHVLSTLPDERSPFQVRVVIRSVETGLERATFPVCLPALGGFERGAPCVRLTRWTVQLDALTCEPAPRQTGKVREGRLVGACEEGESSVMACRDLATDALRWKVQLEPGLREATLCLADDVVVSHVDGREVEPRIRVRAIADGSLRLDRPTVPRRSVWPVAVAGGLIYWWEDSRLLALDVRSGDVRWSFPARGPYSNVVVAGAHVWLAAETDGGKELIALRRETGERGWSTPINAQPRGYGLALVDDALLVTAGRTLTCWRS